MGTTAQKLTYLNDTKGLLKDSINSLGGEITSQTTFRQYATELDNIYSKLPKVSGTGSDISLSPTLKGRLGIVPKGDTYQFSTQGYQLLKLNDKEPSTPVGLTEYSIFNEEITLKGTANSSGNLTLYFDNLTLPAGDYTLVAYLTNTVPSNSLQVWLRKRNENITGLNLWGGLKRVKNFTLDEETTILGGANNSYLYVNGNMSFDTKIKLMILSGTYTADNVPDWEEYTNGASPNPNYPQNIQSVTGNQVVSVDTKNLLEITENNLLVHCTYVSGVNTNEYKLLCTQSDMYVNEVSNVGVSYNARRNGNLIDCVYGETIYFDTGNNLFNKNFFTEFDENLVSLGSYSKIMASGTYTPTNQNCKYITLRFGYGANATPGTTYTLAPIICKVSDTSYEPYQSQEYEINLGKNLLSYDLAKLKSMNAGGTWEDNTYTLFGVTYTYNEDGSLTLGGNATELSYINLYNSTSKSLIGENTIYTYSKGITNTNIPIAIYEYINNSWVSKKYVNTSSTTYIPSGEQTGQLIRILINNGTDLSTPITIFPMIEKGSQATSYSSYFTPIHLYEGDQIIGTPYNWSIKHVMGEVVLDGSENITLQNTVNNIAGFRLPMPSNVKINTNIYSNYYKGSNWDTYWFNRVYGIISSHNNNIISTLYASAPDSSITDATQFKTWLSTHNTKVVYELATPTTEPITNTELIEDLNNFYNAKSYNGQTNISVQGDLPMILDVSAIIGDE